MGNLSNIGRIFYGIAIAEIGCQTIYFKDFPYFLLPLNHLSIPGFTVIVYLSGILFVLAGVCIVLKKITRPVALLLGVALLLIVCFYCIPYELIVSSNYMHLGDWENAVKDLTLAGGALVIAGCFPEKSESPLIRLWGKLAPYGTILFSLTIIDYGISHFLYAKDVADYIPSWIPYHMFWMYFCGVALLGSAIAIILKINVRLFAVLLGTMIFIWFGSLHVPRMIVSPAADMAGEIASACLALAYSGIAFVIAGEAGNIHAVYQRI